MTMMAKKSSNHATIMLAIMAGLIITVVFVACGGSTDNTEGQTETNVVATTKAPSGLNAPPVQPTPAPAPAALQKATTNPPPGLVPPRVTKLLPVVAKIEGDEDFDGVTEAEDNCTAMWNPCQEDMDGDNNGDPCDTDIDGDGIDNEEDNCPLHSNPIPTGQTVQRDEDGDDVGDACDVAPRNSKNTGMLSPYRCCGQRSAKRPPRSRPRPRPTPRPTPVPVKITKVVTPRPGPAPNKTPVEDEERRTKRMPCFFNFRSPMACMPTKS